jgi:hypothetical protein
VFGVLNELNELSDYRYAGGIQKLTVLLKIFFEVVIVVKLEKLSMETIQKSCNWHHVTGRRGKYRIGHEGAVWGGKSLTRSEIWE